MTLQFNRAVLDEMAGDVGSAAQAHEDIISGVPRYVDSYVRLAGIAGATRGPAAALEVIERGLAVPGLGSSIELLAAKAQALEAAGRLKDAEAPLKAASQAGGQVSKDPFVQVWRCPAEKSEELGTGHEGQAVALQLLVGAHPWM